MQAHTLSLNEFKQPKVYSAANAAYINLIRLILLTKGKYQSHPDMGVGIRERFRHRNDDDKMLINLEHDIQAQTEQFLPELGIINVGLKMTDGLLTIELDASDSSYGLKYDIAKESLTAYSTLEDL